MTGHTERDCLARQGRQQRTIRAEVGGNRENELQIECLGAKCHRPAGLDVEPPPRARQGHAELEPLVPDFPIGEPELHVRLVGDPQGGRPRQATGQGGEHLVDERSRAEHHLMHGEHPSNLACGWVAHRQPGPFECQ